MTDILMQCGHTATSTFNGTPTCVSCFGIDAGATIVAPSKPVLDGRRAKCCDDSSIVPSSYDLAFFEYRGPGSRAAISRCKNCPYSDVGHIPKATQHGIPKSGHCFNFEEHGPWEYDGYYCGHGGWD